MKLGGKSTNIVFEDAHLRMGPIANRLQLDKVVSYVRNISGIGKEASTRLRANQLCAGVLWCKRA